MARRRGSAHPQCRHAQPMPPRCPRNPEGKTGAQPSPAARRGRSTPRGPLLHPPPRCPAPPMTDCPPWRPSARAASATDGRPTCAPPTPGPAAGAGRHVREPCPAGRRHPGAGRHRPPRPPCDGRVAWEVPGAQRSGQHHLIACTSSGQLESRRQDRQPSRNLFLPSTLVGMDLVDPVTAVAGGVRISLVQAP